MPIEKDKPMPVIKRTFKARELPRSLAKALHATPEAEIIIHAELEETSDLWVKPLLDEAINSLDQGKGKPSSLIHEQLRKDLNLDQS